MNKNPPGRAGLHIRPRPGNSRLAIESSPDFADFRKPLWRAPAKCTQIQPLPGGLRCTPEASLLSICRSTRLSAIPRALAVWRNSVAGPVRFAALSRRQAAQLWHKARQWDRETHQRGRHGGIIGRVALDVLYVLTFDFLNYTTGRLDRRST